MGRAGEKERRTDVLGQKQDLLMKKEGRSEVQDFETPPPPAIPSGADGRLGKALPRAEEIRQKVL